MTAELVQELLRLFPVKPRHREGVGRDEETLPSGLRMLLHQGAQVSQVVEGVVDRHLARILLEIPTKEGPGPARGAIDEGVVGLEVLDPALRGFIQGVVAL